MLMYKSSEKIFIHTLLYVTDLQKPIELLKQLKSILLIVVRL